MKTFGLTKSFVVTAGLMFFAPLAHAHVHLIAKSDMHSQDDKMEAAIVAESVLTDRFLRDHPDAKLVTIANGDLGGPSEFAIGHQGFLTHRVLALQSKRRQILYTQGNHEAFDVTNPSTETGHQVFVAQSREFQRLLREIGAQESAWLGANIVPNEKFNDLYRAHADIETPSGTRLRVVGMTLDEYFTVSMYDRNAPTQIMNDVRPGLMVAQEQFEKAARDGIKTVIFAIHQGAPKLAAEFVAPLQTWQKEHADPKVRAIKIPLVLGAHNHTLVDLNINGTRVLECESRHAFTEIILDDSGAIERLEHVPLAKQADLARARNARLTAEEIEAVAITRRAIEEQTYLREILTVTDGFERSVRAELRKGREPIGTIVADTLVLKAKKIARAESSFPKVVAFVGFYDSSAYRRDEPIAAGPLQVSTALSIYPFDAEATLGVVSGGELNEAHRYLRTGARSFTPQLSSNLREVAPGRLEVKIKGQWREVRTDDVLALTADRFLRNVLVRAQAAKQLKSAGTWFAVARDELIRDAIVDGIAVAHRLHRMSCRSVITPAK